MEKWAPGITAIKYAALGATPASINRETGVMYLNPQYKGKLTQDQWYFIILHELGHLRLQTRNEMEADRWAHEQYMKEGRSLKNSVYALSDLLTFNKPEDMRRVYAQLVRAKIKDGKQVNYTGMKSDVNPGCYKTDFSRHWLPYGSNAYSMGYNEYFTGQINSLVANLPGGMASTTKPGFSDWLKKNASVIGTAGRTAVDIYRSTRPASSNVPAGSPASFTPTPSAEAQAVADREKKKRTSFIIVGVSVFVVVIAVIAFVMLRKGKMK